MFSDSTKIINEHKGISRTKCNCFYSERGDFMKKDTLLENLKNIFILNYLVENAKSKPSKINYLLAVSLVDFLAFLSVLFLPIFMVKEEIVMNTLDRFRPTISENASSKSIWIVLGFLFILHVFLTRYQLKNNIFMKGVMNLPVLLGIFLTFIFRTQLNTFTSILVLLSSLCYIYTYISLKLSLNTDDDLSWKRNGL